MRLHEIIRSVKEPVFWSAGFDNAFALCENYARTLKPAGITRVYLSGCGTSLYAGYYGKQMIEGFAKLPCVAMEGNLGEGYSWELVNASVLFIGVSNTGGSETVCHTLERAAASGAQTLAITGERESRRASICAHTLCFPGSQDDVPTKTRSYIETLLILLALALVLGKDTQGESARLRGQMEIAAPAAISVIETGETQMRALAAELSGCFSMTVVGSGLHLANAYEAALKISEMGWMNSAAFEMENYMHGRFRGSHVLCPYLIYAPAGPGYAKAMDFLALAAHKGVRAIVVTDTTTDAARNLAHTLVKIPEGLAPELLPLVDILPVYLLGMYLGVQHGYEDPAQRHDGLVAQITRLADLYPQYGK